MRVLAIAMLACLASPALAQDHSGHAMPDMAMDELQQGACEAEAERHSAMGHTVAADACAPARDDTGPGKPEADGMVMDHSAMNHGAMQHGASRETDAIPDGPAPAAAGSGPPRAADAIWGAAAMAPARAALARENGGQRFGKVLLDRLEYRALDGVDGYAWEGQAWYGGDLDRVALKSEGEGTFGGAAEQAELQALWSHAIGPWFDFNAGVRHDFAGPDRTHLVLGIQGLAPYRFELDGNLFLSDKGDLTARVEAELDQRITQRLILQPRAELNLSAQDIPELGVGAGLDRAEIGVRLRYEIAREFAPYIGISQEWRVGNSADYARSRGDNISTTSFIAGVRFWF